MNSKESYALAVRGLDGRFIRWIAEGSYHFLLDQILKHNLNLGEYTIFGLDLPIEEVHQDAMACLADLEDRFS